jgi:hypothetical protein
MELVLKKNPIVAKAGGSGPPSIGRRKALTFSLFGCVSLLAACGGGSRDGTTDATAGGPSPAPSPAPVPAPIPSPAPAPAPAAEAWNVGPLYVSTGSGSVNLANTLPSSVKRGGTFGISPTGAMLPAGMSLSPAGILSSGSATVSAVVGVVFTYDEPA